MLRVKRTWMYFLVGSSIIVIFFLLSQTIPSPMSTIKNHQNSIKIDNLSKKIKSIYKRTTSAVQQPAKVEESVTPSTTPWRQLYIGMRMGEKVITKMKENISNVMSEYPFQERQSSNYLRFIKVD